MDKYQIITQLESIVLQWDDTNVRTGDFDAKTFLFLGEEFGHIHQNGDLDIAFTEQVKAELLKKDLVQKHRYVPNTSITYHLSSERQLSFAVHLLRFSYLVHMVKMEYERTGVRNISEEELAALPESLSSIYWK
ncbi:luciferase family protein [Pedobacter xixiisoli]|uniref:Luciferase domain-containing protein n=1 Tax=Pedobacter xixiisoli TaxID=1476464 RepID=A0A285ZS63_9SPHI|nr:luciferase family protein [Pedobacter xixiisoli]SOD12457.1 hypothetical protein SAMN06297358_0679 [Pedobacter xixiisoli]